MPGGPKVASTPADRPIFFVGAPRSGTTIIFEAFSAHEELSLAAIQWRRIMIIARQEAATIDPRRYIEIRYEDTLQQPFATLDRIIEFSQLKRSEKVHDCIKTKSSLRDMNFKFFKDLKGGDISLLNEVLGDVNTQFGYA
jgi:hypothetical protein